MHHKGDDHQSQPVTYVNTQVTYIILLYVKINIFSVNKNQKMFSFSHRTRASSRVIFCTVTRIQTRNINLARTLPYHQATPSHVTNNEIFSFYHHFQMSYITHFIAITISNENVFNYKVVDLGCDLQLPYILFFYLRSFKNFENLKFKI